MYFEYAKWLILHIAHFVCVCVCVGGGGGGGGGASWHNLQTHLYHTTGYSVQTTHFDFCGTFFQSPYTLKLWHIGEPRRENVLINQISFTHPWVWHY